MKSDAYGEASLPIFSRYALRPHPMTDPLDQTRRQFLGKAGPDDEVVVVAGSVGERQFAALYGRGGRLSGVLGVNMPRSVMPFRKHLLDRVDFATAIEIATVSG